MDDEYENEFEPLPAQEADRSLDDAELEDANPTEEAEAEMEESRELQATTSDWADAEDADVNQDELEDSPPGPDDPIGPDPAEEHPVSPGSPESMEEPPPPSAARSHQDGATNDIPAPDADQPVAPSLAAEEEQSSPARTEQDLARADDTHVPDAEQPDAPAQEAVEEPSSPSRTDHENERSDNGPAPDTQHSATPSQERMEETSPSRTDHENERPDDTPVPDTEQPAASNPETKDEPSSPARTDHQIHHNERPEDTPVPASAAAESPISPDQASSRVEAPAGSRDPKHESPGEKAKQDASPKASEVAPISEPGQTRKASNGRNGRTRSAPNGSIRQGAYKATIDLPPKWSMRGKTSFGSPFKSSKQADEGGMAGDMSSKYNEIRPRAPAWSMIPRSSGITKTADQPGPGEYPQPSTLYGSHPQLPVPGRICKSTQNRTGPTDQVGEMMRNPGPQDYYT